MLANCRQTGSRFDQKMSAGCGPILLPFCRQNLFT